MSSRPLPTLHAATPGSREDALIWALRDLGYMPCADSPFWCFCGDPSEPGLHHGFECIRASALLALVGAVGSDGDPPSREQLTDSSGRCLEDLRAASEEFSWLT